MEQILTSAQNFIVLYYNFVANGKRDLFKFYDPSAIICRGGESKAQKISDFTGKLFPEIELGSEFNVVDYQVVPVDEFKAYNLTVSGNFSYNNENVQSFTQCFTLKFFEEKAAIINDSLIITPVDKAVQTDKELIECKMFDPNVKHFRQKGRFNRRYEDKFKPYVRN